MTISINSNTSSLRVLRLLAEGGASLERSFERLSSGQRINRASDDAAGLAIASDLDVSGRIYGQAIRNLNDGVSALNIADSTLDQFSAITIRLRELASQSANGSYSRTQRLSLQSEANQLTAEFNRLGSAARFNGIQLVDGSLTSLRLQLGRGTAASLAVGIGTELGQSVGDGSFQAAINGGGNASSDAVLADIDGDRKADLIRATTSSGVTVALGIGDGTFGAEVQVSDGDAANQVILRDMNRDGIVDIVASTDNTFAVAEQSEVILGNGDGSFRAPLVIGATSLFQRSSVAVADFNGDGLLDLASNGGNSVYTYLATSTGSFNSSASYSVNGSARIVAGDFNGDGEADIATTTGRVLIGNGQGGAQQIINLGISVTSIASGDFNRDGIDDLVTTSGTSLAFRSGTTSGTFGTSVTFAIANASDLEVSDLNEDGYLDVVTARGALFGRGDGSFASEVVLSTNSTIGAAGDINGDGAIDVFLSNGSGFNERTHLANSVNRTAIEHLNIATRENALTTMEYLESVLERVSKEKGQLGAHLKRLEAGLGALFATSDNFAAALGRLRDIDVAQESSALVRHQILQQVSAATLAQANQAPRIALSLLQQAG